jgi:aerobic carbon-monoxide dehydrogenase medium subunit
VFDELARRRGDYALVGAGVQANFAQDLVSQDLVSQDLVSTIRIAFLSVGPTPVRARHAEAAITGRALSADTISDAQAALGDDLDPEDNEETSATMRIHLARVVLGRLLGRLSKPDCMREDEVT